MSEQSSQLPTPSLGETGSNLGEEEDWLPEETKKKAAKRKPDYFSPPPCDACQ